MLLTTILSISYHCKHGDVLWLSHEPPCCLCTGRMRCSGHARTMAMPVLSSCPSPWGIEVGTESDGAVCAGRCSGSLLVLVLVPAPRGFWGFVARHRLLGYIGVVGSKQRKGGRREQESSQQRRTLLPSHLLCGYHAEENTTLSRHACRLLPAHVPSLLGTQDGCRYGDARFPIVFFHHVSNLPKAVPHLRDGGIRCTRVLTRNTSREFRLGDWV
jgi:hypothetical protein